MEAETANKLDKALTQAVRDYFADCRQRVPDFIGKHFHYPGVWQTNKRALGWDLLRAPFNLLWAPIYLSLQLLALLLRKLNFARIGTWLQRTPSGLTTDVQRYLTAQTFIHLLGRDLKNDEADALFLHLRNALVDLSDIDPEHSSDQITTINGIVHDALEQYRITRTASADIGNSLLSTLVGAFAFQKFTPGGFAVGIAIAGWLTHRWAIDNFFLGQWLGALYYGWFPPSPSVAVSAISILVVMTCLAVVASFSGLLTDPIQSWAGLHRRRLLKMIDKLESDFMQKKIGGFRPKDQFVARVLEIIDTIKAPLI